MKVLVHKCPFTGEFFEKKDLTKYVKHLKDLRKSMKDARHLKHVKDTFKEWLNAEKLKISYVDEITPWIIKNQRHIMDAHNSECVSTKYMSWQTKFYSSDKFEKIDINVNYNSHASNTHECPDNGVTNFRRDGSKPTGYRAFTGQINSSLIRLKKHNNNYPSSEFFNLIGIKTGSGGGGNERTNYSISIFLDDWPGIKTEVEENEILKRLKGT